MATMRERPYLNSNFLVDLGDGDSGAPTAGFAEVVFPDFRIDASGRRDDEPADAPAQQPTTSSC